MNDEHGNAGDVNPHNVAEKQETSEVTDALRSRDNGVKCSENRAVKQDANTENKGIVGDVNMEAAITTDDVIRAGGFGATDDISNLLPVAMDSTDFEASLRDARDFEEPQGEVSRPGLGWTVSDASG